MKAQNKNILPMKPLYFLLSTIPNFILKAFIIMVRDIYFDLCLISIDYTSVYLIENIRIIIDNMLIMLYVTIGMCLAVYFLGRFTKLNKYLDVIKKMFVLNFIIKYFIDFSLRLSIFSIINL